MSAGRAFVQLYSGMFFLNNRDNNKNTKARCVPQRRGAGFFSKYAAAGSAGADAACCDCGKWREPANTTAAADCALSDWGAWSSCAAVDDVACGSTRRRTVLRLPYGGGAACNVAGGAPAARRTRPIDFV